MAEAPGRKAKARDAASPNLETLSANVPPQALDVEEAVIGAMLIEPNCVDDALDQLQASSFYSKQYRAIFEAIAKLNQEHIQVDVITVTNQLKKDKLLEEVGGRSALVELSQKIGAAAHVERYIQILKEKDIQRKLITASYEILRDSYDESVDVDDLIVNAQGRIFDAIQDNNKNDVIEIGSAINEAMERMNRLAELGSKYSGVRTGFKSLDDTTGGLQPSDLIILAARPSVGKTAFVMNIARNAAVDFGQPVAIFSLEMPSVQLATRLMIGETGLDAAKLKGGVPLTMQERAQLEERLKGLAKAPLYIDDTPSLPIYEFRSKAKRLVAQKGVKLIIVDYLQLMQGPKELRGMREQEVAAISRTLKATAKELQVPIIALSQLSRNAVQRQGSNNRPQLSDLRESGSIEQDADMVMFIHRLDYQGMSENPEDKGKTQLIIAKHRNGEVGEIDLLFRSSEVRFVDMEESLVNQAVSENIRSFASAMNTPSAMNAPADDQANPFADEMMGSYNPYQDDFGSNSDF